MVSTTFIRGFGSLRNTVKESVEQQFSKQKEFVNKTKIL